MKHLKGISSQTVWDSLIRERFPNSRRISLITARSMCWRPTFRASKRRISALISTEMFWRFALNVILSTRIWIRKINTSAVSVPTVFIRDNLTFRKSTRRTSKQNMITAFWRWRSRRRRRFRLRRGVWKLSNIEKRKGGEKPPFSFYTKSMW